MSRSPSEKYRDWRLARAHRRGAGRLPTAAERAELREAARHAPPVPLRVILKKRDTYVEVADANPERVNNGCQIYKAN